MNLLACVALCVLAVNALTNVYEYRMDGVKDYIQNLIYNRKHDESLYSGQKLKAFSWKDCSTGSPMLNIQALSILPDPVDVTTNFNIKKTFGKPLKGSYSLPKTEFDINTSIIPSGEYHIIVNATTRGAEVARAC